MTLAEQAAVEKYPHGTFDGELGDSLRAACAVGYHKAERDLADAFQAKYAKELARADAQAEKETIERACEWLFSHLPILVDYYDEDIHTNADRSEFIKLFRTQMEEQK